MYLNIREVYNREKRSEKMKITYKSFEFEIKNFRNDFRGEIYQYLEDLEEVLKIQFEPEVAAEIFVKKNDISIYLGVLKDTDESHCMYKKLEEYFKEKKHVLDFYTFIRTKSKYKVQLLAALGPMKQ